MADEALLLQESRDIWAYNVYMHVRVGVHFKNYCGWYLCTYTHILVTLNYRIAGNFRGPVSGTQFKTHENFYLCTTAKCKVFRSRNYTCKKHEN